MRRLSGKGSEMEQEIMLLRIVRKCANSTQKTQKIRKEIHKIRKELTEKSQKNRKKCGINTHKYKTKIARSAQITLKR